MNKQEYMDALLYYMEERDFDSQTIEEVIEDYTLMIDEALDNGILEDDLEEYLGSPREIIKNLKRTLVFKHVKNNKFVALSPFVATIVFFVLGFAFSYWQYAWLVFLLVPISGILSSGRRGSLKIFVDSIPLISLAIFLVIGLTTDVWHPTWVIFLLIPAMSGLNKKHKHKFLYIAFYMMIIGSYVLSFYFFPFQYNWLILLTLLLPISVTINGVRIRSMERWIFLLIVLLTIIYVILASRFNIWHPLWLIFLLIPMSVIFISSAKLKQKIPFVAYTPFIALILFILAGEFFNGYQWSWLFFLLIPMTAIIKD